MAEGDGDIRGVLLTGIEVSGVSGRRLSGEGEQPRKTRVTIHVSAPEVNGGDSTGGTRTTSRMLSLCDAHASGAADKKRRTARYEKATEM